MSHRSRAPRPAAGPLSLFGDEWRPEARAGARDGARAHAPSPHERELGQFFTPLWAAEALYDAHFGDLGSGDLVLEPTCGPGRFLQVIPGHVPAIGVELDPPLAEEAERRSGRRVLVGDIRTIALDDLGATPTAVLGNPPFRLDIIDTILERAHGFLPEGGRVGLILPALALGTAGRVARYSERWSIRQDMLPRNLYPRLSQSLIFALFHKDRRRCLVGFALFREADAIQQLARDVRAALATGGAAPETVPGAPRRTSAWWAAIEPVLRDLGGEADLPTIYARMAGRRPTPNPKWQDKVRQVLQEKCDRVRTGRYALRASRAA